MNKSLNRTLVWVLFVVVTVVVIAVIGCGKVSDNGTTDDFVFEEKNVRYAERFQTVSISEAGIIYDNIDDGMVHLTTIDKGKDMIFCYDPNCKHIPTTMTRPDSECRAALYWEYTNTAYYEGNIYFFAQDGAFAHKIHRMKTDGAGRELVAELPFLFNIKLGCIFREDKVYYIAKIPNLDDITGRVSITTRIVEVDLLDGSYRFITGETTDTMLQIGQEGNTLYIRRASVEDGLIYITKADINTLEEVVIISAEVSKNEYTYIDSYDEDSFFYYGKQTNDIGIRNIDGTIETVLIEGPEGEYFGWPWPSSDGMIYSRTIDYGDEKVGCYFLDFITGEVTNITEEWEKYGLFGYDGYYDVFVAHDGKWKNWTLWSKEKVLGEAKE